jgi:hypothetical protein
MPSGGIESRQNTTTPTDTGPAQAPRPTSSSPATNSNPSSASDRSKRSSGHGIARPLGRAADFADFVVRDDTDAAFFARDGVSGASGQRHVPVPQV